MGLSFLVGVQLARGLGVEQYGVYGLAMSIVALLNVPTQFGIPQLLTREVARAHATGDTTKIRGAIRWANRTVLTSSLAIAVCVAASLELVGDKSQPLDLKTALYWGLLLIPLVALGNLRGAALKGIQRIVLGQAPELLLRPAAISLLLLVGTLGFSEFTPTDAMAFNVIAAALALAVGSWWLKVALPPGTTATPSTSTKKGWLASAFPMAMTEGMRMAQGHLAIIILGFQSNNTDVGLYRIALSIIAVVAAPISMMNVVTAPVVAKLHTEGKRPQLQKLTSAAALSMLAGVMLLSLPFITSGTWLIGRAFGAEFEASLPILLVLAAGQGVSAFFGINATALNMTGHERRATRAFGAALVVDIAAALLLIPLFGSMGAASANLIAVLIWNVMMWWDVRKIHHLDSSALSIRSLLRRANDVRN